MFGVVESAYQLVVHRCLQDVQLVGEMWLAQHQCLGRVFALLLSEDQCCTVSQFVFEGEAAWSFCFSRMMHCAFRPETSLDYDVVTLYLAKIYGP